MSETYFEKFSNYYDIIHKNKSYSRECDLILKYSPSRNSLLDIGCGTLNHSLILSNSFSEIVGIDLSKEMLAIGNKKVFESKVKNIRTYCENLSGVTKQFDTVISMFNVVNHIERLNDLINFFQEISLKINSGGTLIFDCWNGIANIIEQPKPFSEKIIDHDYYTLTCKTKSETDLNKLLCSMETKVEIFDDLSMLDSFEYNIKQKIWTHDILTDVLNMNNFEIFKIIPNFDDTRYFTIKDYRLTFICTKN